MPKSPLRIPLKKAIAVYEKLARNPDEAMSRSEILDLLGSPYKKNYWHIVNALAAIGKVTKRRGPAGGIEVRHSRGLEKSPTLTDKNKRQLEEHFHSLSLEAEEEEAEPSETIKENEWYYNRLRDYLDATGLFDRVEVCGSKHKGAGWENVDLLAVKLDSKLRYHAGVNLKVAGVEVKGHSITIRDIQQTASYLRSCHFSYLCFYDSEYHGKNLNVLLGRLRDNGAWEWASLYRVGLIVAFKQKKQGRKLSFQTIKEAPANLVDEQEVEDIINQSLGSESRQWIEDTLHDQLKSALKL